MAKMYFRYGAMNCGKTAHLLQVAHNYNENGFDVLVIKSSVDKKGDKNIVSRTGLKREVDILVSKDEEIIPLIDLNTTALLVDEVQFMTESQIKELWYISKVYDIPVICYGLKTNFKAKLFEGSKAVIELADDLEELPTICSCGKKARYNARYINGKFTSEGEEVAIDGIDAEYKSLCAECYIKELQKQKIKQKY